MIVIVNNTSVTGVLFHSFPISSRRCIESADSTSSHTLLVEWEELTDRHGDRQPVRDTGGTTRRGSLPPPRPQCRLRKPSYWRVFLGKYTPQSCYCLRIHVNISALPSFWGFLCPANATPILKRGMGSFCPMQRHHHAVSTIVFCVKFSTDQIFL